jgi:hypothetical protein
MVETFKEIIDLTLKRVDEADAEADVLAVIKEAINHAYMFDLSKLDSRFNTAYIPVVNGIATLPDDIRDIKKITPNLLKTETRIGNAIFSDRSVTFNVVYSAVPEPMVDDTDTPDLSLALRYLLSTYACFSYYSYRKKANIADMFKAEYESEKQSLLNSMDSIEETVQDVL